MIKILTLNVEGDNWKDILTEMSDALYKLKYVKSGYRDAIINREEKFPTGIELPGGVGVAIPHAEAKFVNEEAVVLGFPQSPVDFKRMDDPEKIAKVHCVFLLLIKNPEKGYVKFLSKLTTLFQRKEFTDAIKKKKIKEIVSLLEENL